MDKIEEIKILLNPYSIPLDEFEIWAKGFDAAMELQLPVKFAEWQHINCPFRQEGEYIVSTFSGLDYKRTYKIKELYDYWLENIYQPE